jgi:hypothetical protein
MIYRFYMVTMLLFPLFYSFPVPRDIIDPLFAVRYQTEIYNAYKRVEATEKTALTFSTITS